MNFDSPLIETVSSISYRFRDIGSYLSKVADCNPSHLHLAPLFGVTPVEFFADILGIRKLDSLGYRVVLLL